MSDMARFFKKSKKVKANAKYAPTQSLTDEKGNPLEWEIKPVSTREDEAIRDACTLKKAMPGKSGLSTTELDSNKYIASFLAASVVFPDLRNAELQNSYGVMTPEDLVRELIDNPGEYLKFLAFVQRLSGMDTSFAEEVDAAKN